MTPKIRAAQPDDTPALVQIEEECFSTPHWDPGTFLKYDSIVAEWEGRVAGFLVAREIFPETRHTPAEREILNLAVAPLHRRLGIATALLHYELRHHATHFLEVRQSNNGARELYRKMGFTEIGRRPNYYDSPAETAIVMRLK